MVTEHNLQDWKWFAHLGSRRK